MARSEGDFEWTPTDASPADAGVPVLGLALEHARNLQDGYGTEFLVSTRRMKHSTPPPETPRGRIPASATLGERMARKLKTIPGRKANARRKAIVEPVFGQIHTRQGKHVLLRGPEKSTNE